MEILIALGIAVVLFLAYQARKTVKVNNLCFKPFPEWIHTYAVSAPGSIDKAIIAKSLLDQTLIHAGEMNAIRKEEYQEVVNGFKNFGPDECVFTIDSWIDQHLPVVESVVGEKFIIGAPARYIGVLMIVAASNVNPQRALREFVAKAPPR